MTEQISDVSDRESDAKHDEGYQKIEGRNHDEDYEWMQKLCEYLPLLREKKGNFLIKGCEDDEGYDCNYPPRDEEAYEKLRVFELLFFDSPFYDKNYLKTTETLLDYYPEHAEAYKHANLQEIGALITFAIRSNHFCQGDGFADQIEDGTYIPLLENLERIVDESYHPWKKTDLRVGSERFIGMKNTQLDETLPAESGESEEFAESITRSQMGKVLRLIDETYIAGSSFVNLDDNEYHNRFFGTKQLSLVLEPENQYDTKAVRVEDAEHVKLGYLPKALNDIPYRLLCGGYRLYAYPISINSGIKGPEYRICVCMDIIEPPLCEIYQEARSRYMIEKEQKKQELIRRYCEAVKQDYEKAKVDVGILIDECEKVDKLLARQFSDGFFDHFHVSRA